jgi:hypothetical protein
MGHVRAGALADLNPVSILEAKYLVIADPKAAIETLQKKLSAKAAASGKGAATLGKGTGK